MTNARRRRQIRQHRPEAYPPFEHNAAVRRIKNSRRAYRSFADAARKARRAIRAAGVAAATIANRINSTRQEHR